MSALKEIQRLADELAQPHVVGERVRIGWTRSRNPIYTTHYVSVPGLLVQLEELIEPSYENKAFRRAGNYGRILNRSGTLVEVHDKPATMTGLRARRTTTLIDSPAPLNVEALSRLNQIEFGSRVRDEQGNVIVMEAGVRDWISYFRLPPTPVVGANVLALAEVAPRLDDPSACDLAAAMRLWHGLASSLVATL